MKIIGDTTPNNFTFISEVPVEFGEYVIAKNVDNEEVLAIVKDVIYREKTYICNAKVLGVIKDKKIYINRKPINPEEDVKLCDNNFLTLLFFNKDGINLGSLLTRRNVRVFLDTNKFISRHFAILSITGGGKSNTVSVLCKELARKNATVIIIDPHGEYSNLYHIELQGKVNSILPSINPAFFNSDELAEFLGIKEKESKIYLKYAYDTIKLEKITGLDFLERMIDLFYEWIQAAEVGWEIKYYNINKRKFEVRKTTEKDFVILSTLYNLLNEFLENYSIYISEKDIISQIKPNHINVIDLSGLEVHQMISLVGYIAKELLSKRIIYLKSLKDINLKCEKIKSIAIKNLEIIENKYKVVKKPFLLIVEEAHIFIPRNSENNASFWLGKIAREGRKFGVGLGLISQRPKQLNPDVLSQTGTKIVLRIVEPEDQKYIMSVSEDIGEELAKDLSSLDIGEALISGIAINLPSLVKIDKFDGIYGGKDIDFIKEWRGLEGWR